MVRYLFELAMWIIEEKYPEECNDPKCKHDIFAIVDMVIEELYNKNGQLFFMQYLNELPDARDFID